MMYHFEVRIGSGQAIGDFAGAVAAAVVDYDDFVALSQAGKFGLESSRHPFDVAFLVMAGQEDADTGQAGRLQSPSAR